MRRSGGGVENGIGRIEGVGKGFGVVSDELENVTRREKWVPGAGERGVEGMEGVKKKWREGKQNNGKGFGDGRA